MGDENSLAGTTKAHKHTAPASDGGFLETTETGVTNMSEGSIGYYDSSSVLTELTSGSLNQVLTMGAAVPSWATAGSGLTATNRQVITGMTDGQTTTSTTFQNITGGSATLSNSVGGSAFIYFSYCCENSSIGVGGACVNIGGVDTSQIEDQTAPTSYRACISGCGAMAATNGDTVQTRWRTGSGTRQLYNQANRESLCQIFEIY